MELTSVGQVIATRRLPNQWRRGKGKAFACGNAQNVTRSALMRVLARVGKTEVASYG